MKPITRIQIESPASAAPRRSAAAGYPPIPTQHLTLIPLIPILLLCLLVGCQQNTFPSAPYASTPPDQALAILQQQAAAIHTISATGSIVLRKANGDSIHLDAALVAEMPDKLHLRAWKFNRTVFDLTLDNDNLWLLTPDDPHLKQQLASTKTAPIQFARAWTLLTHDFFFSTTQPSPSQRHAAAQLPDSPSPLTIRATGNVLLITRTQANTQITCRVAHATLTSRTYSIYDSANHQQFKLSMDDYTPHDGIPFPSRIVADSKLGRFEIHLHQITINHPLSPTAFLPSPRAEKLP